MVLEELEEILILEFPHKPDRGFQGSQQRPNKRDSRASGNSSRKERQQRPRTNVAMAEYIEASSSYTNQSDALDEDIVREDVTSYQLPTELFYPAISKLFEEFWDMEMDEDPTSQGAEGAFFGRINQNNYADFGLAEYFDDFCNLPVIKVSHDFRIPAWIL